MVKFVLDRRGSLSRRLYVGKFIGCKEKDEVGFLGGYFWFMNL